MKTHWFAAAVVYLLVGIALALPIANLVGPGPFSGDRHVAWALVALTQAGAMFIVSVFHLRDETAAA